MKRLLNFLFPCRAVLVERGEFYKLMTGADLTQMKRRWAATLAGRSQDPCVRVIMEMIEIRISQANGMVQRRDHHQGNTSHLVSYGAGEAAGLNDLLLEITRAVHPVPAGGQG